MSCARSTIVAGIATAVEADGPSMEGHMVVDCGATFDGGLPPGTGGAQKVRQSPVGSRPPARLPKGSQPSQLGQHGHPTILLRPWHCAYHGADAIRELVPGHAGHAALKVALLNAWRWETGVQDQIAALVASGEDERQQF